MIKTFRHKGIETFFLTGKKAGIQPAHAGKLRILLTALDTPNWKLHKLTGDHAGHYSLKVSGNWRTTFAFEGENAVLVDYQDYH